MDQRCWVEGWVAALTAQLPSRDPAAFLVDQRQQAVERVRIALRPAHQELCDISGRWHDSPVAYSNRARVMSARMRGWTRSCARSGSGVR